MTGWTWDYVEQTLTIPRLQSMHKEWSQRPPLPLMVAAYLGIKPQESRTADELINRLQGMQGVSIKI